MYSINIITQWDNEETLLAKNLWEVEQLINLVRQRVDITICNIELLDINRECSELIEELKQENKPEDLNYGIKED